MPSVPTLLAVAETALPVLVLVALAGTALATWLITAERARRLARVVRRQDRSIAALEKLLSDAEVALAAERAVSACLAAPTTALLTDVYSVPAEGTDGR